MDDPADKNLLLSWAENADEIAFATLASRYAGFVYGSALRRVSDDGLAQEIAQDVFVVLAKQASKLSGHVSLTAWLHRTTMLISLDRVRRRARRERNLSEFQSMNATPTSNAAWSAAVIHLDEALDKLRRGDREILMLHFAERFTFPEIAGRIGMTTDAVRMRTTRALNSLARSLTRRGVTISVVAVAAGLGSAFAQVAPAGLAISAIALGSASKVTFSTMVIHAFQTMKTIKYAAALIVLGAVGIAMTQRAQIAHASARIAELQSEVKAEMKAVEPATANGPVRAVESLAGLNIRQLGRDALSESFVGARRVQRVIVRLDDNNLAGLMKTAMGSALLPEPREKLLLAILEEMSRRSSNLHLEWCLKILGEPGTLIFKGKFLDAFKREMERWARAQPEPANRWFDEHRSAWAAAVENYAIDGRIDMEKFSIAGTLVRDLSKALPQLERLSPERAGAIVREAWRELDATQIRAIADWAAQNGDVKMRREVVMRAAGIFRSQQFNDEKWETPVADLLLALPLNAEDRRWIVERIAMESTMWTTLQKSPMEARAAFLEQFLPPEDAHHAIGAVAQILEPDVAFEYLRDRMAKKFDSAYVGGYIDGFALRSELRNFGGSFPGRGMQGKTGFRLALAVENVEQRRNWLALSFSDLWRHAPAEARGLLTHPDLPPEDLIILQNLFGGVLGAKK